jgi:hydroxymethylbilane synthase
MKLTLGTRGSALALAQADLVKAALLALPASPEVEVRIIRTTGDERLDVSLSRPEPSLAKGLFTKELEEALLRGEIDLAVHSLKDLPTELPNGLQLGAVLPRHNPADLLISKSASTLQSLPKGAQIATSSPRRARQLEFLRPDLRVVDIRGNVTTRLSRLSRESEWDAIVLARAGLERLGFDLNPGILEFAGTRYFVAELTELLPAVGQGVLALEISAARRDIQALLEKLNDPETWCCIRAERRFLQLLGGGCQIPMGIRSRVQGAELHLEAIVFGQDARPASGAVFGSAGSPETVAGALLNQIYGKQR